MARPPRNLVNVVILGGVGSGKTVLLTVLAREYEEAKVVDGVSCYLEPRGREAVDYKVRNGQALYEQKDWPRATGGGELHRLAWDLHFGRRRYRLDVLDYPGEAYHRAFAHDGDTDDDAGAIKKAVDTADVVLLLLSLYDYLGRADPAATERRVNEEWAPLRVLQYLRDSRPGVKVCIVLTKADELQPFLPDCDDRWRRLLAKYCPAVAQCSPGVSVFGVAAVNRVDIDEEGRPRPAGGFHADGLGPLLSWISHAGLGAWMRRLVWPWAGVVAAVLVLLAATGSVCRGCTSPPPDPPSPIGCPTCYGTGSVPCTNCNATGNLSCTNCGGNGRVWGGLRQCKECSGRGELGCGECIGSLKVTCPACRGTGCAP